MSDVKQKSGREKTLYLDFDVISELEIKSEAIERSDSWMANHILREALGLPPRIPKPRIGR